MLYLQKMMHCIIYGIMVCCACCAIATHLGPTADEGGGGGVRVIVTHPGPTADGGGGYARDRNTPQTYDRRADL